MDWVGGRCLHAKERAGTFEVMRMFYILISVVVIHVSTFVKSHLAIYFENLRFSIGMLI